MKERLPWIDVVKGIAMLSVILGHAADGYIHAPFFPEARAGLQIVYDFIYAFHMPLFFMVSGYLWQYTWKSEGSLFARIRLKLLDLAVMYTVFTIVFWGGQIYR